MKNDEVKIGMKVYWNDITGTRSGKVEKIGGFTIGRGDGGRDVIIIPDKPLYSEEKRGGKAVMIAGLIFLEE